MFCPYTLPLARPAQVKIQMLTTRWRVLPDQICSPLKNFLDFKQKEERKIQPTQKPLFCVSAQTCLKNS